MAERPLVVRPKRLVQKYGENFPMWSFSKINTFENCKYEYYLSYIKKVKSLDNVYTMLGTYSHSILEDYYTGKILHEDMKKRFETDFIDVEISDYKFSSDEEKNDKMRNKYKECVLNFFKNHKRMADKVAIEKLVWIDVDGHIFRGYVDAIYKDEEGNIIITDFKTSSIYKGSKIPKQAKQLLLYALGLHQGGVPLEKLKVRWLFLKYLNVSYMQKNGKLKTMQAESNKWVSSIKTPLKKDIKQFYNMEDWEADLKLEECIKNNSINNLDQSIYQKYTISDCYVYADVTEDAINNLKQEFVASIEDIQSRGDKEENWIRGEIEPGDEYYCNVLCGVRRECKYYQDYLNKKNGKQKEDEDIMAMLDEILPF